VISSVLEIFAILFNALLEDITILIILILTGGDYEKFK